ncbi:MAG: hypothetical protein CVU00_07055 [Bacteroidetes bacterium HGW-Bacteroidetes-17]|nr:MAG: hypothetical protein CVU00_07055 [Bacteroidetes bacterium HGW-Bacteroidetes-17]
MWSKNIFILFLISIGTIDTAFAQDSNAKTDSTKLYGNIESYSNRSRFNKFLYRLIFKPVAPSSKIKKVYKKEIQKPYSSFEGKIIRHINIETLDPFGYSVADTNEVSQNFLFKTGNSLHIKSKHITIRNLLLIRQNQKFDSLLVKESERLVRSQAYVHDVSFYVKAISKNSDSVDVFIRELDNWSIAPVVDLSSSRVTFTVTDKNFLGFGHKFRNEYTWYHSSGDDAFNTNYFIPNIRNTYINANLNYGTGQFKNLTRSFAIDRPFFSPLAKWAGGVYFTQQLHNDSIRISDSVYVKQRIKFNAQDYWASNAIQIFKGNTEEIRTTNLITALRFYRIRYLEKPDETLDTLQIFSDENFYLASIGISTRKYIPDKFIFNFGLIEDVPIGKVYSITGGYQIKNNSERLYLGARISFGNYHSWGYLSSNFEYGTFFHSSKAEQGVFTAGINYFTKLFEIGKWKFRQFVKPQLTIGINRFANDSLTLQDGYGLDDFNSNSLIGTSRLLFTLQTQSYAPWKFIGFRFGPYFIFSMGLLGDVAAGFKNSRVYSQIGLGVLIKNDYLVFNTFQISIAFYPSIPGNGQNIFKMNSFKTSDFGYRDFEIGKPAIVIYR